jgi:proline dehydrogenase
MIPPVADRFVAGETAAEALEYARLLNDDGVGAILNLLGEHHTDPEAAAEDAAAYRQLVADVGHAGLDACVSVKPTQLGLGVDAGTFESNLADVVAAAREADVFVWLDMEDRTTTDATLDAFERFVADSPAMGVCLQANLRRTPTDIDRLTGAGIGGKIRLVKGAYDEPPEAAHRGRAAVDAAYEDCLERLCRSYAGTVAVGSHDPRLIDRAVALAGEHDVSLEFQMLMGVREAAQRELARDWPVYQYVPYGGRWLSYFSRRVAERRENLAFALRAVAGLSA